MKVTYSRFPGRRCRMPVLLSTPPGQSSAVKTGKKGPDCQKKRLQKRRNSDCHLATEGTKEQASGFVGAGQSRPMPREAWFKHKKRFTPLFISTIKCVIDCFDAMEKKNLGGHSLLSAEHGGKTLNVGLQCQRSIRGKPTTLLVIYIFACKTAD